MSVVSKKITPKRYVEECAVMCSCKSLHLRLNRKVCQKHQILIIRWRIHFWECLPSLLSTVLWRYMIFMCRFCPFKAIWELENYESIHFCTCETIDGSHSNFSISKEASPPDSPGEESPREDSPGEDSPVTMREACWRKVVWFGSLSLRSVWMDQEQFTHDCSRHV